LLLLSERLIIYTNCPGNVRYPSISLFSEMNVLTVRVVVLKIVLKVTFKVVTVYMCQDQMTYQSI